MGSRTAGLYTEACATDIGYTITATILSSVVNSNQATNGQYAGLEIYTNNFSGTSKQQIKLGVSKNTSGAAENTELLASFYHSGRSQYYEIGTTNGLYLTWAKEPTTNSSDAVSYFENSVRGQYVKICAQTGYYPIIASGSGPSQFLNWSYPAVYCYLNAGGLGVKASSFGPFTGAHDGFVDDNDPAVIGDIMVDVELVIKRSVNDAVTKVAISTLPKQKSVIGILSAKYEANTHVPPALTETKQVSVVDTEKSNVLITTRTGFDYETQENIYETTHDSNVYYTNTTVTSTLENYVDYVNTHMTCVINSLGEGAINVCGEGGDIEIGDYIVSSSMPGKGMKQDDDLMRNYTVAKARENVTFSSPTEVKQIACTYHCG
jgi:hypothetical protein